jgi:hypothetical protein
MGTELSPAMQARYGIKPRSPIAIAGVALLAFGFVALIGWITLQLASPGVQTQLVTFTVTSATNVDVTFDVQRDGQLPTVCVLRARDVHHVDVGYARVQITPGRSLLRINYPIATLAPATSAEVLGCANNADPRVDPPQFAPGTVNPPQQPTVDGR